MKRTNDHVTQDSADANKKARFSQAAYGDMYTYPNMNPAAAMMMSQQYPGSNASYSQSAMGNNFSQFTPNSNAMYGPMSGGYGSAGMSGFPAGFSSAGFPGNPAAAAAAVASMSGGQTPSEMSRTIYLGNLPRDTEPSEILDQVKTGPVESIKILPEKNCAFLSFLDTASAQLFYQEFLSKKLIVRNTDLKIGWGKPSGLPPLIAMAVQNGASRNVYLGQLDSSVTEEYLKEELSKFGPIEHIKIIPEKNIGFVHFLSISSAVKCVSTLPTESAWSTRRVNYGKDRCAYVQKGTMDPQQQQSQYGFNFQSNFRPFGFDPYGMGSMGAGAMMSQGYPMGNNGTMGNVIRTLYLGNIPEDATCEDLCNMIRGGILFQIRLLAEKHIAFVTFVDAMAALNVYNLGNSGSGLVLKSRRLRVGWGKPSTIPPAVLMAVQNGASRNIYIGGIEDDFDEEKLRADFSVFGEIELVNTLKEKNCAFVNFTNIMSAMKAISGIKMNEDYKKYKINYGKDRCGNPPKRLISGQTGQRTSSEDLVYHNARDDDNS